MRLYVEFNINNFEAWSGAVDTKNRIIEAGKSDLLNAIAEENRQKAIRRAERKARKRAETIYYIKQKLSGLTMAAVGIITPILLDGDCTFSLFALPVGIYLLFTKEKVMMF